jgi:RNA-binding protein
MPLTSRQRAHLRGLAHHVDPVVLVGDAGLSDAVLLKVDVELKNHELIKVRVADGPTAVDEAATTLAERCKAELVQVIGKMVVLYRAPKKDPKIKLPREPAEPKRR